MAVPDHGDLLVEVTRLCLRTVKIWWMNIRARSSRIVRDWVDLRARNLRDRASSKQSEKRSVRSHARLSFTASLKSTISPLEFF